MRGALFFLLMVLFLSSGVYAQDFETQGGGGDGMDSSMFLDNDLDRAFNDEKKVEKFQTFFIQEVFTRPMFEMQESIGGDEEDDEDGDTFISSKQDKETMNQLLAHVLARDLAKKDAFKLKKILTQRASQF